MENKRPLDNNSWIICRSEKDGFIEIMCANCKLTLTREALIPDCCPYCGAQMMPKEEMN